MKNTNMSTDTKATKEIRKAGLIGLAIVTLAAWGLRGAVNSAKTQQAYDRIPAAYVLPLD